MRILMPLDESGCSAAAVAFVASRAATIKEHADIALINVQYPVPANAVRALGRQAVLDYQQSLAKKIFKPALASLARAGLAAHASHVVGSPGSEVGRIAADDKADLIVMGSHGHTGFRRLLFGSVTNAVLASCTTPLLVLRDAPLPKRESLGIGIALDGSKFALAAARWVIRHRELFGTAPVVTLMHAAPDLMKLLAAGMAGSAKAAPVAPEQLEAMQVAAFENALAPARKLFAKAGITTRELRLVDNNAGDAIAAQARKDKLDLLVLGSHGQGALTATVLGSVATRITLRTRLPLLFIRQR